MRHFIIAILFILLLCQSCASTNSYTDTQIALNSTVDKLYRAAQEHDAQTLYNLLSEDIRQAYTFQEFSDYFDQNYDVILEYISRTYDTLETRPYTIEAIRSGDPCGYLSLTLPNDDQWKISSVPELRSTRTDEEHKQVVIEKLKTEQFVYLINKYFEQHPELDLKIARQIRRELLFLNEEHVTIYGHRIIISIQDTANVSMLCTENGLILADIKALNDND